MASAQPVTSLACIITAATAHLKQAVRDCETADFNHQLTQARWRGNMVHLQVGGQQADVGPIAALPWTVLSCQCEVQDRQWQDNTYICLASLADEMFTHLGSLCV